MKQTHASATERVSIVVLGEKDHGKSTLIGRLLYETASIPVDRIRDARTVAKDMGKDFEWAHLLDSFRYEREHEMTLDTTRAIVKSRRRLYEFIDVPGHEELVKNMVSGASHATCAAVVVAADRGIQPQTVQHVRIAQLLGINRFFIVINKCDTIGYSRNRFYTIARDVRKKLKQIGLERLRVLPLAAVQGENLTKKSDSLSWFRGPTFLEAVETISRPLKRATKNNLLVSIQDTYEGGVVVGRVESGCLSVGDDIAIFPTMDRHRIRELSAGGRVIRSAKERDVIEIILDHTPSYLSRGSTLVAKNALNTGTKVLCRIFFFTVPQTHDLLLESYFRDIHAHSNAKMKAGEFLNIRLELSEPLLVHARFIIKDRNGNVIGFGNVT